MSLPEPFAELSPEEEQLVVRRLRRRVYRRRETIFRAGDPPRAIYFIQSGVVELFHPLAPADVPLGRVVGGRSLGAEALLLDAAQRVNAQAASQLTLEVLTKADLEEILAERPSLAGKLSAALGARIIKADEYLVNRYLRNQEALKSLPSEALRSLASRFQLKKLRPGSTLPDDLGEKGGLYALEAGRLRLVREAAGVTTALRELSPGAVLGPGEPSGGAEEGWQARVLQESAIWFIPQADSEEVLRRYPSIEVAPPKAREEVAMASPKPLPAQLGEYPIFAELPKEALADIADRLVPARYRAGERIILAKSPPQAMYFIQEGSVREVAYGEDTSPPETTILGAGDFFGALALLTDTPYSTTVEAISEVQAWSLSKAEFERLLLRFPRLALSFSQHLTASPKKKALHPAPWEEALLPSQMPMISPPEMEPSGIPARGRLPRKPRAELTPLRAWFRAQPWAVKLAFIALMVLLLWLLLVSLPTVFLARGRGGAYPLGQGLKGASGAPSAQITRGPGNAISLLPLVSK